MVDNADELALLLRGGKFYKNTLTDCTPEYLKKPDLSSLQMSETYGSPGGELRPSRPRQIPIHDPIRRYIDNTLDQKDRTTGYSGLFAQRPAIEAERCAIYETYRRHRFLAMAEESVILHRRLSKIRQT